MKQPFIGFRTSVLSDLDLDSYAICFFEISYFASIIGMILLKMVNSC